MLPPLLDNVQRPQPRAAASTPDARLLSDIARFRLALSASEPAPRATSPAPVTRTPPNGPFDMRRALPETAGYLHLVRPRTREAEAKEGTTSLSRERTRCARREADRAARERRWQEARAARRATTSQLQAEVAEVRDDGGRDLALRRASALEPRPASPTRPDDRLSPEDPPLSHQAAVAALREANKYTTAFVLTHSQHLPDALTQRLRRTPVTSQGDLDYGEPRGVIGASEVFDGDHDKARRLLQDPRYAFQLPRPSTVIAHPSLIPTQVPAAKVTPPTSPRTAPTPRQRAVTTPPPGTAAPAAVAPPTPVPVVTQSPPSPPQPPPPDVASRGFGLPELRTDARPAIDEVAPFLRPFLGSVRAELHTRGGCFVSLATWEPLVGAKALHALLQAANSRAITGVVGAELVSQWEFPGAVLPESPRVLDSLAHDQLHPSLASNRSPPPPLTATVRATIGTTALDAALRKLKAPRVASFPQKASARVASPKANQDAVGPVSWSQASYRGPQRAVAGLHGRPAPVSRRSDASRRSVTSPRSVTSSQGGVAAGAEVITPSPALQVRPGEAMPEEQVSAPSLNTPSPDSEATNAQAAPALTAVAAKPRPSLGVVHQETTEREDKGAVEDMQAPPAQRHSTQGAEREESVDGAPKAGSTEPRPQSALSASRHTETTVSVDASVIGDDAADDALSGSDGEVVPTVQGRTMSLTAHDAPTGPRRRTTVLIDAPDPKSLEPRRRAPEATLLFAPGRDTALSVALKHSALAAASPMARFVQELLAAEGGARDRVAVVVSVSVFQDPAFEALPVAERDAGRLVSVLRDRGFLVIHMGAAPGAELPFLLPTAGNVTKMLQTVSMQLTANSALLACYILTRGYMGVVDGTTDPSKEELRLAHTATEADGSPRVRRAPRSSRKQSTLPRHVLLMEDAQFAGTEGLLLPIQLALTTTGGRRALHLFADAHPVPTHPAAVSQPSTGFTWLTAHRETDDGGNELVGLYPPSCGGLGTYYLLKALKGRPAVMEAFGPVSLRLHITTLLWFMARRLTARGVTVKHNAFVRQVQQQAVPPMAGASCPQAPYAFDAPTPASLVSALQRRRETEAAARCRMSVVFQCPVSHVVSPKASLQLEVARLLRAELDRPMKDHGALKRRGTSLKAQRRDTKIIDVPPIEVGPPCIVWSRLQVQFPPTATQTSAEEEMATWGDAIMRNTTVSHAATKQAAALRASGRGADAAHLLDDEASHTAVFSPSTMEATLTLGARLPRGAAAALTGASSDKRRRKSQAQRTWTVEVGVTVAGCQRHLRKLDRLKRSQALFNGTGRWRLVGVAVDRSTDGEHQAATNIQAAFRGSVVRRVLEEQWALLAEQSRAQWEIEQQWRRGAEGPFNEMVQALCREVELEEEEARSRWTHSCAEGWELYFYRALVHHQKVETQTRVLLETQAMLAFVPVTEPGYRGIIEILEQRQRRLLMALMRLHEGSLWDRFYIEYSAYQQMLQLKNQSFVLATTRIGRRSSLGSSASKAPWPPCSDLSLGFSLLEGLITQNRAPREDSQFADIEAEFGLYSAPPAAGWQAV